MKTDFKTVLLKCICGSKNFCDVFFYNEPHKLEIRYQLTKEQPYRRQVKRCSQCGHYVSTHEMDTSELYKGDYAQSTYGDAEGIHRIFTKIISLDPSKSDNHGRVERILKFAKEHFAKQPALKPSILDVGLGLGVFLYAMKKAGWNCSGLEPDPEFVKHAKTEIGVEAIQEDFMDLRANKKYDVITFNKVLEHVLDPVAMLAKSRDYLKTNGFVYVELPDGEMAVRDGKDREEFAIDHHHIFSLVSFAILCHRADFLVEVIERLQEPSTKYTLRAFLTPNLL